jgi:uncharacterized membrane protein
MKSLKHFSRISLRFFLRGLLYTIPIGIIILVFIKLFNYVDDLVIYSFPGIRDRTGLGIIVFLLFVTAIGFIGSTIFVRPIKAYFRKLLDRAPILKTFYTSINDLLSAFVGKKKSFNKPVLVQLTRDSDIQKLGFVTKTDLHRLGIPDGKVAVYLPHSYNFSGNLFIVPRENVTPIEAKSADVMKFIVSGGISEVEKEQ